MTRQDIHVGVAGVGGIGLANAAWLRQAGFGVSLWAPRGTGLAGPARCELHATGVIGGSFEVQVAASAAELSRHADVLVIAVPVNGHKAVFDALAPHLSGIFGGEGGVSAMRMPAWGLTFGSSIEVYYLTLFWAALGIALLYYFTRTPLGRLCEGLRENTHRLGFLGYDVHRLRLMVFTISAAFSGLAGALLATGLDPALAAALAAYQHGVAGQRAAAAGRSGASALLEFIGVTGADVPTSGAGPRAEI